MTLVVSDFTRRDLTMEGSDDNSLYSLGNGKSLMILIEEFVDRWILMSIFEERHVL